MLPVAGHPGADDLQHARVKIAMGILTGMFESTHINRGRCTQMARECALNAAYTGRASVVVGDGESPLRGEGKQSMRLAQHSSWLKVKTFDSQ